MTPAAPIAYETAVLWLFLELPETLRPGVCDPLHDRRWFHRGVSLQIVETALLLGSLRRLQWPAQTSPLPPIRSLAYFQPIVKELLAAPHISDSYRDFLRSTEPPWPPNFSFARRLEVIRHCR